MYTGLLHLHSPLRYLVLIALFAAFVKSLMAYANKQPFGKLENILSVAAMGFTHLQAVVGLILYFVSPKVKLALGNMGEAMAEPQLRFFAVEHISMMLFAVVLITIGRGRAKRATDGVVANKKIAIFYGLAIAIIFAMIPWPFMKDFGTWI